MKKSLYLIASLLFASAVGLASERTGQIDRYKAVFGTRPVNTPTSKTVDAPVTGNGDIGITMCSTAEGVRFFIGKNDFWKSYNEYPRNGIALPGWFDISSKEIREGEYYAEQLPGSACIKASYFTEENTLSLKAWVAEGDNKVVIDLTTFSTTILDFGLYACESNGSKNSSGVADGKSWAVRKFEGNEDLVWPSGVAMALNRENGRITVNPGRSIFVISVFSNFDTEDYQAEALKNLSGLTEQSVDALWDAHCSWWEDFWNLSSINIGDEYLEKYYYLSQYLFACSSREGKFAPGLWGPFITVDDTAWAGDYHLNYNYQSPYWGSYSSNHICLVENYDQPILDFMEEGGRLAKELLGCRGLYYPVGIGPIGLPTAVWPKDPDRMEKSYGTRDYTHDAGMMFWGQKSNASMSAINVVMRFYGTWDKAYAEKMYPFIKACAEFWEDWLVWEDGRYVDRNDSFWEVPSWDGRQYDTNPTCGLGLIRLVLKGAEDMSALLGVDKASRKKWIHMLDNLSEIPVGETADGRKTMLCAESGSATGKGLNRVIMHGLLIPPGICGPNLTPEINDIMLSDMALWEENHAKGQDWGSSLSNGVETVYPGAARLGYPADAILSHLKERIAMQTFANGYIEAWGGGVETLAAVPFTINEMLLQSFEGIVRVFPDWTGADASFETLRADGAFLVSSSMKEGKVERVDILSEQGRTLLLENPWPGEKVSVSKNGRRARTISGDLLKIRTKAGQELEIIKK